MKQLLVSVCLVLTAGVSIGQTDQLNLQKYWKLRNDFREKFVKIGPGEGESLPARVLKPTECIDNINYDGTGYGTIKWGDGMIRQGYYLGLLATEYRLLKDAGQDVTGVLNELYYALNAINRLDYKAEFEQGMTYSAEFDPSLNGFYMREDIPEDFAQENWGNTQLEARCVDSPHYKTNNAQHIENPDANLEASGNSYQNTPSSDQFSSLLVGFSLIHKLVEPTEFVQPPGAEIGFYIVGETQAILHRMMTYMEQRNWMMIDVNGWPVNNGGGDVFWSLYPILTTAERITGYTYNTEFDRKLNGFNLSDVQYCITGYPLDDATTQTQEEACYDLNMGQAAARNALEDGIPAGPANNQNVSVYQTWLSGGDLQDGGSFAQGMNNYWEAVTSLFIPDLNDDGILISLPWPFNTLKFIPTDGTFDKSSAIIISNYGVAAGIWGPAELNGLSNFTGNRQLELINAILRNELPPNSQQFYKAFLDQMEAIGPYNLLGVSGNTIIPQSSQNGWASEHRWTWSSVANGSTDKTTAGIYNGLDYMLFYNLYHLLYKNSLPTFQQTEDCFCTPLPTYTGTPTNTAEVNAIQDLNNKIAHLSNCSKNVFTPVSNTVSSLFTVQPYFANYADMNIFPAKFQTENATVTATGILNVRTFFKICNTKTLTIQAGGKLLVQKGSVDLRYNSHIDNSGTIEVKAGTTLTVGAQATLKLRAGALLDIEDNATVVIEPGASLQYFSGAVIHMRGPNSQLVLGGNIRVMDNSEFSIVHLGSGAGKIIVNGTEAGLLTQTANTGKFKLAGKGKNDPLLILQPDCKLWVPNNQAQSLTLQQCQIQLGANAALECNQPLYTGQVTFTASATNRGLTTTEGVLIQSTDFMNVPVFAKMNIENKGTFDASNCSFTATNAALNPNDQALVRVEGRGYNLSSCHFYTAKNFGLYSVNLTLASVFAGGSVQYYSGTIPANHVLTGIYDNSTAEVSLKGATITQCNTGVQKRYGKLTLRCNTFQLNKDVNINPNWGCLLNMNATALAGYNQLFKTTNNKNIYLTRASENSDIKNGYNFIEYVLGNTINGSLDKHCTTCPTLDFSGNQWVTVGKTPTNIGTIYSQVAGATYAYILGPTANWQTCPPGSGVPGGGSASRSAMIGEGRPLIYAATLGDSIAGEDLIYLASSYMSQHNDSASNDLLAVDLLHDFFIAEPDVSDAVTSYWSWLAFHQMKAALEAAFGNELLYAENNAVALESEVMKYVHALEYLSAPVITAENYTRQFYHEIDKAHLLRMIGHSAIGLNILTELENCGLDSAEQSQVNYWKQEFEKDVVIDQIGFAALDTTIVIDTSGYLNPALVTNGYSFGAVILDLNTIQYPNCAFYAYRDRVSATNGMQVFPNPADNEVQVTWKQTAQTGSSMLTVTQSDGRHVYGVTLPADQSGHTLAVNNWQSGVYIIRLTDASGAVSVQQLVVE